jgi:CRISPR/Cas system-associated exonuclease Cas4 (RecB family)
MGQFEIDHLSYSSISSYLMCAANWKFHYLDKIPTPTASALAFGSAFHNTIEGWLGGKEDSLTEAWSKHWKKQTEGQNIDWGTDIPEELFNKGIQMFTQKDIVQSLQETFFQYDEMPIVEMKVELRVPEVPIPVIGYIDIITGDKVPGDFKTSSRSWNPEKALDETQPLFYLAAMNQMGYPVPDWRFRHYVFVKTKTPKFQMFDHVHNPGQIMWLFQMIQKVWKGIEAGVYPENPTGWKCNPKYCDYWSICRGKLS